MKLIDLSTKSFPGIFVKVDDRDFEWLSHWKWHTLQRRGTHAYARRFVNRKTQSMHRVIMGANPGQIVDHINGDGFDNRRENLRICSASENMMNRKKHKQTSSRFKGVYLRKSDGKFVAHIKTNRRTFFIGSFKSEIEAAKAYNAAAIQRHGDFACLNTF